MLTLMPFGRCWTSMYGALANWNGSSTLITGMDHVLHAGRLRHAVHAIVVRIPQVRREELLKEVVDADVSVEVALQQEALHKAVTVLGVAHGRVPPDDSVHHVLELDLVHVVCGCAGLLQQALVNPFLVLCQLLHCSDAACEQAAGSATHVSVWCLCVPFWGPAKAFDGLLVHKQQPMLAVGRHGSCNGPCMGSAKALLMLMCTSGMCQLYQFASVLCLAG